MAIRSTTSVRTQEKGLTPGVTVFIEVAKMEVANWPQESCPVCGKSIIRSVDGKGKTILVNPEPNSEGTVKLVEVGGRLPRALTPVVAKRFGMIMRVNHEKTCDRWRGIRQR